MLSSAPLAESCQKNRQRVRIHIYHKPLETGAHPLVAERICFSGCTSLPGSRKETSRSKRGKGFCMGLGLVVDGNQEMLHNFCSWLSCSGTVWCPCEHCGSCCHWNCSWHSKAATLWLSFFPPEFCYMQIRFKWISLYTCAINYDFIISFQKLLQDLGSRIPWLAHWIK